MTLSKRLHMWTATPCDNVPKRRMQIPKTRPGPSLSLIKSSDNVKKGKRKVQGVP